MKIEDADKVEQLDPTQNSFTTETSQTEHNSDIFSVESIEHAYGEANKKLVTFVSKNIEIMKAHLLRSTFPSLQDINKAYINYLPVSCSLNDLYQKVRFEEKKAQEEYNLFDDQAMNATKLELNRDDNKRTWFSAAELKSAAHTKYKSKYAQLSARVALAEGRRSFVERLCKAWDSWQFGLGQISRNMIAEANANKLDMQSQNLMLSDPDDAKFEEMMQQATSN